MGCYYILSNVVRIGLASVAMGVAVGGCSPSDSSSDAPVKNVSYGREGSTNAVMPPPDQGPLIGKSVVDLPSEGLINQEGVSVGFDRLPSRPVLLSFIYTRCPMAKMCPLLTKKARQVQEQLGSNDSATASFVLITLDPDYDRPEVLRSYGKEYKVDFSNWDFWTGPRPTLTRLYEALQVTAKEESSGESHEGGDNVNILHNMRTYLLDAEQRIRYRFTGSRWSVDEVAKRLRELASSP